MMARCPGCNKFPSLETQDPEVELDVLGTAVVGTVRLVCASVCCGEELKEATFNIEDEIDATLLEGHVGEDGELLEDHELEVEEESSEATERVAGKGRGAKMFRGVVVRYSVRCSCQESGAKSLHDGEHSDEIQASCMDELT
jgi:hypothetical protein